MSPDPEQLVVIARGLAQRAAERHMRRDLGDIDTKSSATDPVTEVDRDSESLIVEWLRRHRPDDAIIGEEGANDSGTSGLTWVIDPLDGTVNYLYDYPSHAVSLAVRDDNGTIAAVVHDTALDEVYTATAGGGAFRDGVPITCSATTDPAVMLLATGFGYERDVRRLQAAVVADLLPEVRDIRRGGSAAVDMCHVASGRCDAYYETGPNLWDVAAGLLIVEEAGGRAIYDPRTSRIMAAGAAGFSAIDGLVSDIEQTNRRYADTQGRI